MTDYKLVPKSIVDELAQFIRQVDGNHRMGAGALADKICERFRVDAPAVQEEPVAWIRKNGFRFIAEIEPQDDSEVPLYTAPPAQPDASVLAEALVAIRARIRGEFDHPALVKHGPLGELRDDVERIIDSALASPAAEPATDTDAGTETQQPDMESLVSQWFSVVNGCLKKEAQ